MLFKIENADVYFVASMHLLRPEDSELPDKFWVAHSGAKRVVFESNLDAKSEPPNARFIAPDNLRQSIHVELFDAAVVLAGRLGVPNFIQYRPWYAALLLALYIPIRAGFGQSGVDRQIWDKTEPQHRMTLEGSDALSFFDSVPSDIQAGYLAYVVSNPNRSITQINKLLAAWQNEDLVALENFLDFAMNLFPTIMKGLIDERNRKWLPEILRLCATSERTVFVLGALHYVGDVSIQKLMKVHGYSLIAV